MSAQTLSLHTTGLRLRRGSSVYTPHLQITSSSTSSRFHGNRFQRFRFAFNFKSAFHIFVLVSTLALFSGAVRTISIVFSNRRRFKLSQTNPIWHAASPSPNRHIVKRHNSHSGSHKHGHRAHFHNWGKKVGQKANQHVRNSHGSPKAQQKLPKTRWWTIGALRNFKPHSTKATDIRLVTLQHACYCTERSKFLLPSLSRGNLHHFPIFMRRHGIARHVRWKSPRALLARSSQQIIHIVGTTILWRGRDLTEHHSHLVQSLIPIRSLIDELQKARVATPINLAAESFAGINQSDPVIARLHEYYFGDIPYNNRLNLRDHRPKLLCFDNVVSLGTELTGYSASPASFAKVKELIKHAEQENLPVQLTKQCKDQSANRKTVWIINQKLTSSASGAISNIPEVITAVNHAILRSSLAGPLQVKVIQAPNIKCKAGTIRKGCLNTDCTVGGSDCAKNDDPLRQVATFNNMTLLIIVAGPATEGIAYMPSGSSVLEVVPHGVRAEDADKEMARGAGVRLHQMTNGRDENLERSLIARFGDVAEDTKACWIDPECREGRVNMETRIDARHLKLVLRTTLKKWQKSCTERKHHK